MTRSEHYREAERILQLANDRTQHVADLVTGPGGLPATEAAFLTDQIRNLVAAAQVHAMLATASWNVENDAPIER